MNSNFDNDCFKLFFSVSLISRNFDADEWGEGGGGL